MTRGSTCRKLEDSPYPRDWTRASRGTQAKSAPTALVSAPRTRDVEYDLGELWAKPLPFIVEPLGSVASSSEVQKFKQLAEQWERETVMHSSLGKIVMHPAYQKIIGMGPVAIPLILAEMKREPNHWFWALDALTDGESPAAESANLTDATKAWIDWGVRKGYLQEDAG